MSEVGASALLPDIQGVLDALAFEVSKKGRNVRRLGKQTDEGIIAKGHRIAWKIYRDGTLRDRFAPGNYQRWGFAMRARPKGKLYKYADGTPTGADTRKPAFVHTGAMRDQMAKRNSRRADSSTEVRTNFSIFGGALNAMGSKRGRISEVISEKRQTVTRAAHTRRDGRTGKPVKVRGYQQQGVKREYKVTLSPRTYAEEWAFRPTELVAVQQDANLLILEGFRSAIYDRRTGQIRTSIRERMRGVP